MGRPWSGQQGGWGKCQRTGAVGEGWGSPLRKPGDQVPDAALSPLVTCIVIWEELAPQVPSQENPRTRRPVATLLSWEPQSPFLSPMTPAKPGPYGALSQTT